MAWNWLKKRKKPVEYNPEVDTGEIKPIQARIAAREANDRYSEYPSNGLTPQRLAQIFREADEGNIYRQMELFEEIEEKDPHLFSQLQTRKLAVAGLDWEVQPFSESEQDKEIAEFISEQLNSMESFDAILIDMLDAIGKGISILEITWGIGKSGENIIENIEQVHAKKLFWDGINDTLKICTAQFPSGIPLPQNKFVLHRYKAKSGHASRAGILRIVSWMYLFKNYDIKDWISFCEVFGMPIRLGKYDPAASEDDKGQLMEAIISLGSDAAGIVPSTTMIEFIEAQKTTSVDIYESLARYCDEQMSKAILGQTLTSDSGGGSFAQSKTHDNVRHDLTVADAKALAVTIRRDIIRPLVIFNFGYDAEIPLFQFDCRESENQKELAEIYKTLSCDIGLELPKSHLYKKFNIPKPETGEDIVKPKMQMLPNKYEPLNEIPLKDNTDIAQKQLDDMAEIAQKQAGAIFAEMFQPLINLIDKSNDLSEVAAILKDERKVQEIYKEMDSPELSDLLQQAIYLSHLIGRGTE